jgi:hypothetical protein
VESRIGHLHCRVRAAPGVRVPPGLERMARERVGEALGQALEAALGDDPGVYVLREVRADVSVDVAAHPPDRLIARRWADQLAAAITRAIAEDGDDAVARFADEAEFIARFAADLADGVAWERWFYGAFAELRPLGRRTALRKVLLDNRGRLPAILAWLARHGTLERVLAALDPGTLAALERRLPDPELVRPLMAAALRIAQALGMARTGPASGERLLEGYLAAAEVVPTWRDRGSLARGVLDALRFLVREGHVPAQDGRPADDTGRALAPLLAELDWLDEVKLRAGLEELMAAHSEGVAGRHARARPAGDPELVRQLADAVRAGEIALDGRDPTGAANALRLRAALAARADDAAALRAAGATVAAVLEAVGRLARHRAAAELWALIDGGEAHAAWRRYAELGGTREDVQLLTEAEPLVRRLAPGAGSVAAGGRWIESGCAGALLPTRAALDLRLPAIAGAVDGVPPFPELLLALALRWGGEAAFDQRADTGLAAALGFAEPPTAGELAGAWEGCTRDAHDRLRADLRHALEARGLAVSPSEDDLAAVEHGTLGDREADDTVGLIAAGAVRTWVGWLRGFGDSSAAFALDQFVRRPGAVALSEGCATIELERRPLDVVLEMAGYLDELDAGTALPRRIGFELAGD